MMMYLDLKVIIGGKNLAASEYSIRRIKVLNDFIQSIWKLLILQREKLCCVQWVGFIRLESKL